MCMPGKESFFIIKIIIFYHKNTQYDVKTNIMFYCIIFSFRN